MIKTIAHLADIHIRKLHRFVEYRDVFNRLYKKLRKLKPDLIYIGGDIVHGKSRRHQMVRCTLWDSIRRYHIVRYELTAHWERSHVEM